MAHTPGPWIADDFSVVCKEHGWSIAEVWGRPEEDLDNAALIAATPEMLEALESVEWVTHTGSGGQRCPWCQGTYPDHKAACMRQAAIAKARGDRDTGCTGNL